MTGKKMKTNKIIFLTFLLLVMGFLTFRFTLSYFSDNGSSSDNVLSASAEFPTVTPTTTPTPPPVTPTPQIANHVVISEVQINGATALQDFVELYNPTNASVDLNGWQLRRKDAAGNDSLLVLIGTGKTIPAHGFFLWANSQSGYGTSVKADVSNTNNIGENNSLELEDASDGTVDQVGWGNVAGHYVEGTPYPTSPGSSASIERKAYTSSTSTSMSSGGSDEFKGNGFDAGDNSTDFITRTISEPQYSTSSAEIP